LLASVTSAVVPAVEAAGFAVVGRVEAAPAGVHLR
jgi:hypothetical protein